MVAEPTPSIELFYCYARKDQDLRDELDTHLSALHRSGFVKSWYDGGITPGMPWEEEIEAHLNTASIVLLLISPDFIKSDYCYSKEMTRAIARHEAGEARVLPILLRPVDWIGAPFSELQMLPVNARPVTLWPDRDEAFENVALGIRKVVNELIAQYKAKERMEALQREQERIEALQRKEEQERLREQERTKNLPRREEQERIEDTVRQQEQVKSKSAKIFLSPQQFTATQRGLTSQSSRRLSQDSWWGILALITIVGLVVVAVANPSLLRSWDTSIPPSPWAVTPRTKPATAVSQQTTSTPDPNLKDRQQELDDTTKNSSTISGFQMGDAWSTVVTDTTDCLYDGTNYMVNVNRNTQQYAPCLAAGLSYKNFALQVTMDIKGDVGGVILRSHSNANTYYRLAVSQIYTGDTDMPTFTLILCDKGACSTNSTNVGVQVDSVSAKVDKHPVTLTVIVRDKNIDVYANKKFVTRFTDTTDTAAGQVGVYAADLNHGATVKFSDLKIWSLDK